MVLQSSVAYASPTPPVNGKSPAPSNISNSSALQLNQRFAGEKPLQNSGDKSGKMQLKATVSHSENLSPAPNGARPGDVFIGKEMLAKRGNAPKMFKIPDWLAGVWMRNDSTETSRTELPSGKKLKPAGRTKSQMVDTFGSMRDKNGKIWQIFSPAKAYGEVDRGTAVDHATVLSYNMNSLTPECMIVEVTAMHIAVDKRTQKVLSVFQDEELNTYTQIKDGLIMTDSSVKVFDGNGKPLLLTRAQSTEMRIRKL